MRRNDRGQLVEIKDGKRRIYWTGQMLSDLKRWFPTTKNEELSECLGVSPRTLVRKARELGLEKDKDWLDGVWMEHCRMMKAVNKRDGWKCLFKPGNMSGNRFRKGHKASEETKRKQGEAIRRWAMANPTKTRERGLKAAETRRRKSLLASSDIG